MKTLKEKIKNALNQNIPFTSYRKPNNKLLNLIIQNNNKLLYLTNYQEKGFVFAPFNNREKTIIFPLNKCESESFLIEEIKLNIKNKTFNINENDKKNHINLVEKGITFIKNNETPKIVLSRKETINKTDFDPVETFFKLLKNYETAFVYIWFHPKIGLWLGATPETLVQIKNNSFKTMALAGTQEYNATLNVKWKDKEIEEQKFVTNYIISHLENLNIKAKYSDTYTVKAGNLLHLQSDITGRISNDKQLAQIIKSLHPTPAVCGLPKEKAKQFILTNENYNREFYTGFLGELNFEKSRKNNRRNVENQAYKLTKKTTELFVNLRCMKVNRTEINLYIGGGITKDSNAEDEFLETVAKSKIIKTCL